jgi:MerR family transcriptional regulator, global nitrogen regulator
MDYRLKKVLTIGAVEELTGLSPRQIRYYEERKLINPKRSAGGTRKYSFDDVEKLVAITEKMNRGISTFDIRNEAKREDGSLKKKMIEGQLNSYFKRY